MGFFKPAVTFFSMGRYTAITPVMKRILIACLVLLGVSFRTDAQNVVYDENVEVREVPGFHTVIVSGGMTVYLSQGTQAAVAVSTSDEKNLSKIKTEVNNGVLSIHPETGVWNTFSFGNKKVKAYITVSVLQKLVLNGGSIVKCADPIKTTSLATEVNGGSILNAQLSGAELKLEVNGGSIAEMKGNFATVKVEASGGSVIKAGELVAEDLEVEANAGSVVTVRADKQLDLEASGGSIINYKGEASVGRNNSTGGSIIKKKS